MQEPTPAEALAARPLNELLLDVAKGRIAIGDLPRRQRRAVVRIARTDPLKDALARVRTAQLHQALAIVDDAFARAAAAGDITDAEAQA